MTHREALSLLLHGDTGMPLYAHEVKALTAAIAALDELDGMRERMSDPVSNSTVREAGFYWVRLQDGEVTVAQWSGQGWHIIGSDECGTDAACEMLSPRLEEPPAPQINSTTRDISRYQR